MGITEAVLPASCGRTRPRCQVARLIGSLFWLVGALALLSGLRLFGAARSGW